MRRTKRGEEWSHDEEDGWEDDDGGGGSDGGSPEQKRLVIHRGLSGFSGWAQMEESICLQIVRGGEKVTRAPCS